MDHVNRSVRLTIYHIIQWDSVFLHTVEENQNVTLQVTGQISDKPVPVFHKTNGLNLIVVVGEGLWLMFQGDDLHLQLCQETLVHQIRRRGGSVDRTELTLQDKFMDVLTVQCSCETITPLGIWHLFHNPLETLRLEVVTLVTDNSVKLSEPLLIQSVDRLPGGDGDRCRGVNGVTLIDLMDVVLCPSIVQEVLCHLFHQRLGGNHDKSSLTNRLQVTSDRVNHQ